MNLELRLKRLFKCRAKRLLERAESLNSYQFENILGNYDIKDEEEKEIKMCSKKHEAKIKMKSTPQTQEISIDIGLAKAPNSIGKEVEDTKGDVTEEELKKSREETNQIWGMKRTRSIRNKEEFESSLKDFSCTICMDYMIGAKKLQWGHCFWDQCISFWFLREKFCPICKEKVRDEKNIEWSLIDFTVEHILTRASKNDSTMLEDLKSWQKRRMQYFKWKRSHWVKTIKIGEKVDVRDTEYIWCSGNVEKILKSKYNCADLYYIHYDGWSRWYDEYIPADSDRLAPKDFYTSRNDIPKYTRHEGPDERVYGNVVEGGNDAANQNRQPNNSEGNNNNEQHQQQNLGVSNSGQSHNQANNNDNIEEDNEDDENDNEQAEGQNQESSEQGNKKSCDC